MTEKTNWQIVVDRVVKLEYRFDNPVTKEEVISMFENNILPSPVGEEMVDNQLFEVID